MKMRQVRKTDNAHANNDATLKKKSRRAGETAPESAGRLDKPSLVTMRDVLGLKKGEKVLIVTNPEPDVLAISKSLAKATKELGGKPQLVVQPVKTSADFMEPKVKRALEKRPEIILSISASKLGRDKKAEETPYVDKKGKKYDHLFTYLLYGEKSTRSVWTPAITAEVWERTVAIDYTEMYRRIRETAKVINDGSEVRVTADNGTDITFSIKGLKAHKDDGDYRKPGKGGNLPAGEVYVSPKKHMVNGTLVFDAFVAHIGGGAIPRTPVSMTVKDGFVDLKSISGGKDAGRIKKDLEKTRQNEGPDTEAGKYCTHIGEFGIGMNDAARPSVRVLEAEKVYGTVHFAIGRDYDQQYNTPIHLDCGINAPNIWVDGRQIMDKGKLLL